MARPPKIGLDYFPFDVGFFNDEKIAYVAGEFGIKAEIVAVKLLCAIYRNGYFIEWNDEQRTKILCSLRGVSSALFDQILNRLLKWGFLHAGLFESDKILTSVEIQRRYFEATKFRKPNPAMPYLLVAPSRGQTIKRVSQTLTPVSQTLTPVSQTLTPVSQTLTLNDNEKEKTKEKENFPPNPLYKEKENKKEKDAALIARAQEPPPKRNFIDIFFDPRRADVLRKYCAKIALADDENFSQLRNLVDDADNYLAMSGETFDSFGPWARSIQNLVRADIERKRNNQSPYSSNVRPTPNLFNQSPRGYSSKLPPKPACGIKRRPDSTT